jgi:hypothetical protein
MVFLDGIGQFHGRREPPHRVRVQDHQLISSGALLQA